MIFNNRHFGLKQNFELLPTILKIERKSIFEALEYEISLEQIGANKKVQTIFNGNLFFGGLFVFLFGCLLLPTYVFELGLAFNLIAILMMVFSLINRKKTIEIPTYELPIILYYSNHNKASVIGFADTLIQASNQFLYNKYSKVDRMLPIEPQLNSLQFLRNREVISEEEYDTLKDQLLGKEIKNGIGFSRLL